MVVVAIGRADLERNTATAGGGRLGIWRSGKQISSMLSAGTISKVKVCSKQMLEEERNSKRKRRKKQQP